MKMLMFDFRESEREFFNTHKFADFDIEFISTPLNDKTGLTDKQLNDTDVISVFITSNVTGDVMKKFKNLRIVSTRSTGYNHIDLEYCIKNNIAVFNVGEYGADSVAQYTFMLILALLRKLIPAYFDTKQNSVEHKLYEGRNLSSLTIGILGCGAIGSSVAKIAHFFGMRVYACSYEKNSEIANFTTYCSLNELLIHSDIITLHLPYNSSTFHIINNESIQQMKTGVYIVNTARGELIDTISLYNNILNGKIGGAALDVVECDRMAVHGAPICPVENGSQCLSEALAIQKLMGMTNIIITPHIAYSTKESVNMLLETTFNSLRDYSKGLHTNQLRL